MAETGVSAAARNHGATSEESLVLDHLRRIERTRAGCAAVHFHLSELQAPYRKRKFIRIAARSFDTLIHNHEATLYVLANFDMALICRDVRVEDIDLAIVKLRSLFSEDPLTTEDFEADERFATWYDLSDSTDYASFETIMTNLEAQARSEGGNALAEDLPPLSSADLMRAEQRLQALRLTEIIRQQPAVDVRLGKGKRILFKEHYVRMSDLMKRVTPDADVFADPWLFHYITDVLDRRMLAVVGRMDFDSLEDPISLNLHVGTVTSSEFQLFNEQVRRHAEKIIVEVQMIDVIADMGAFTYAQKWLRDQGYRILIDGLFPLALQFFDPGVLDPDLIKVNWSPNLDQDFKDIRLAELKDVVDYTGRDKIVLGRVESEAAVKWGLSLGVHRFQGFFVDKLVDAMAAKGML